MTEIVAHGLRPKFIKTPLGHFAAIEWNGVNESSIRAFDDRILVFPDQAAAATPGGIELPDDLRERLTQASETGIIIDIGENAWLWNSDRTRRFEGKRPQIGERIIFARYSGSFHEADDGRCYRLMDDKCMGGFYVLYTPSISKVKRPPLVVARA